MKDVINVVLYEPRPKFTREQILLLDYDIYHMLKPYLNHGGKNFVARVDLPRRNNNGKICDNIEEVNTSNTSFIKYSISISKLQNSLFNYLNENYSLSERLTIIQPDGDNKFNLQYNASNMNHKKFIILNKNKIQKYIFETNEFRYIFSCSSGNDDFSKVVYNTRNLNIPQINLYNNFHN